MDRGLVLELSQIFRAPRGVVFRALSEPAMLTRWWGPAGFTTPQIAWDLRVGGRYRLGMQPPGAQLFQAGEFLEIDPPRRLAFTFGWEEPDPDDRETVVALTLHPLDAATKLTLSQGEFASEARLALHRSGWSVSFEKLRALVESAAGSDSSREAPPAVQADASGDAPLHRP